MNIRLHKLRYRLAAMRSRLSQFSRHPSAMLFYLRHYYVERRVMPHVATTVISYPKSGRTWVEQLLLAALGYHKNLRLADDATFTTLVADYKEIPLIVFTHAGGSWETATFTAEDIASDGPRDIVADRFVYLYRDPRDVLVSAYYHARNRSSVTWLTPQDMLDDPIVGLPKVVAFMNNWIQRVDKACGRAMRVSYEKLKEQPQETMVTLCRFMDLPFSDENIRKAIVDCSFERLKERQMSTTSPWLAPTDPDNPNSFKFREGRTGSYRKFFDADQINWIEDYMARHLLNAEEYLKATR